MSQIIDNDKIYQGRVNRERRIVNNATQSYIKAEQDYSKYLYGSPIYSTYYQQSIQSTQDRNLETTSNFYEVGGAKKYREINDTVLYGINLDDIMTDVTDYGLESRITGTAVFLPDTIQPIVGDAFIIDVETDMEVDTDYSLFKKISFRVVNVEVSRATVKKYYKITYQLEQTSPEDLKKLVSEDEKFELVYDDFEKASNSIVNKADAKVISAAKTLYDGLLRVYTENYYDESMDLFIYRTENGNVWNPYLHNFLVKNKIIQLFSPNILEDIYLIKLTEAEYPTLYNERIYRNSIFGRLETKNKNVKVEKFEDDVMNWSTDMDAKFLVIGDRVDPLEQLRNIRTLSFFNNDGYLYNVPCFPRSIDIFEDDYNNYNFMKDNFRIKPHVFEDGFGFDETIRYDGPKAGEIEGIEYDVEYVTTEAYKDKAKRAIRLEKTYDEKGNLVTMDVDGEEIPVLSWVISNLLYRVSKNKPYKLPKDFDVPEDSIRFLDNIIIKYMNNNLKLTVADIEDINRMDYSINQRNYHYIPIVLFILKKYIDVIK